MMIRKRWWIIMTHNHPRVPHTLQAHRSLPSPITLLYLLRQQLIQAHPKNIAHPGICIPQEIQKPQDPNLHLEPKPVHR